MRKVIAAINMTLDGYCDHTAITPDEEIHDHYSDLLKASGTALYGRVTYELMTYWQSILKNPTGEKSMDDFAVAIDQIPKIVFSHTLKSLEWETARLANRDIREEVSVLKQQPGKDILVCSPGLIIAMMKLNLLDEFQLCIHPVITGSGLPLFKNINERVTLKLIRTKTFASGAVIHYYSGGK